MIIRRSANKPAKDAEIEIKFAHCPAKTRWVEGNHIVPGHTVDNHCQIVGEVARALIARYPPELATALFPVNAPFAAACHDIGKVSPTFVKKLGLACDHYPAGLPALPQINDKLERQWGGHAGVSQIAAEAMGAPRWVPEILGEHHGFTPTGIAGKRAHDENFGGPRWQTERVALVEELKRRLNMDWPVIESPAQQKLVAGLTSVADWIGSGSFFEDPVQDWRPRIAAALDSAGFVAPTYRTGLSFDDVFGFEPRIAQSNLIEAVSGPGVYVLEAPTGLGKTEAALYAAYQLLARQQATGVYFALPTQLTSNKLHQRFNAFLERILAPDCSQRQALLLHAGAWLVQTEMGEEGRPGGSWFQQKKRGLLAPFAVGTIDQALMAAMHVKHGFVRAFGLAGKVIVLDEVHTYDAYTGTLLDALIALLHELHCTVIILSATLNQQRRAELLGEPLAATAYPLITARPRDGAVREITVAGGATRTVNVRLEEDATACVDEALARAARGEQVLWIENTVAEAQERYLDLAARAQVNGIACGLLHSRFTRADREQIEARWVDLFGAPGWSQRSVQGRILVGTQVLEQSLDIDADFLVSRFAPTDMLIQRIGRLWRHGKTPRPASARPEVWLLAPQLATAIDKPPTAFSASAFVYAPYVLCRSLEAWQGREQISLPGDVRGLIEATYAEREEQGPMARWRHELLEGTSRHKGIHSLRQLARIGLATGGKTLPETKAETRYSEMESLDVLLVRRIEPLRCERATRLVLLDGSELCLPQQRGALDKRQWRELTIRLMRQQVPVRASQAPVKTSMDTLKKWGLGNCFYLGDPNWPGDESSLRVAIVDEMDALRGVHDAAVHGKYFLEYRDDLGYRVLREDEKK